MNPYQHFLLNLQHAAEQLKINQKEIKVLQSPERIVEVSIPLKRSKDTVILQGFRVQHNSKLGPYKGGLRFHADLNLNEAKTLSALMTIKNAVAGLPFGGGKGGIKLNPQDYSKQELKEITRSFVRRIADVIGADKDIPAPDVNTNPEIMGWIMDEYSKITGRQTPAVVTGKNLADGGLEVREEATGFGGAEILDEAMKVLGKKPEDTTVAIQGFGNVGVHLARFLDRRGYRVIAIAEVNGGTYHEDGLDIDKTVKAVMKKEMLKNTCFCKSENCHLKDCQLIAADKVLEQKADVVVPAAIDNQITVHNMKRIKAKIILEMANNGITPEAEKYLNKQGVLVVPDVLANSGGVIASYFEWKANLSKSFTPNKDEQFQLLSKKMRSAWRNVQRISKDKKTSLREAAYILALKRLLK